MKNKVSACGQDGQMINVGDVAIAIERDDRLKNCSYMYEPYVVRDIAKGSISVENLRYISSTGLAFGVQKDDSEKSVWRGVHPSLAQAYGLNLAKHGINETIDRKPYTANPFNFVIGDTLKLIGITLPFGGNDNSWKNQLFVVEAIDCPYAVVRFVDKSAAVGHNKLFIDMRGWHFEKIQENKERKIIMNLNVNLQSMLAKLFGVDAAQVQGVRLADKVTVTAEVDHVTTSDGKPAVGIKSVKIDFGY